MLGRDEANNNNTASQYCIGVGNTRHATICLLEIFNLFQGEISRRLKLLTEAYAHIMCTCITEYGSNLYMTYRDGAILKWQPVPKVV